MDVNAIELALAKIELQYQEQIRSVKAKCIHMYSNGESALNPLEGGHICVGCGETFDRKDSQNR